MSSVCSLGNGSKASDLYFFLPLYSETFRYASTHAVSTGKVGISTMEGDIFL